MSDDCGVPPLFPGFRPEDFTKAFFKYPRVLEQYWHVMTNSEAKVLTFLLRMLPGFQKTQDAVSLSQFMGGVGSHNKGTGISRTQVRRAIEGLEEKGFIIRTRQPGRSTVYRLRYTEGLAVETVPVKEAPLEIQRLIRLFMPVAEHRVETYLQDRTQIKAIERLVEYYGVEKVEAYINTLPTIHGKRFMPVITSPVELEQKLPKLADAIKRRRGEEGNSQMLF